MPVPSNPLPHCEQFLVGTLRNDAGVAAVFAGLSTPQPVQVYTNQAPQGKAYPYIIVFYYSSTGVLEIGRNLFTYENPLYVIKAVSKGGDFGDAHNLMIAVENALRNASGQQTYGVDTVLIQGIRLTPPRIEMTEEDTDGVRINHIGNHFRLFVTGV